jgi:RNA polymerase sigma-70 factor, ECF subfamily
MTSLHARLEHRRSQRRTSDHVDRDMSRGEPERLERHAGRRARARTNRDRITSDAGTLWVPFGVVSREHDRQGEPGSSVPGRGVDDEDLVRLAQQGRRDAFEELVRRHADRLYGVVLRFLGDPTETEEVVQETFPRAWRGIGSFERRAQFFTWLYRIGLNEARRRATRRPPQDTVSIEQGALESYPDLRQAPEPRAEQRDVRAALERSVRALPAKYRAPLILRDVEGLSTEQAAAIMGLREAAFKSRLHRARLAVRQSIEKQLAEDR